MQKSVWPRHLEFLIGVLFPCRCLACDRPSVRRLTPLGLCMPCRGRIRSLVPPLCKLCAEPLAAAHTPEDYVCISCRTSRVTLDRLIAAWSYEGPVTDVVRALKFSGRADLAAPLGEAIAARVSACDLVLDTVVPVPLHWSRRFRRGYDQTEEIARHVAAGLQLPMSRALRRHHRTRPQTRLPRRERRLNVRSAFRVARGSRIGGSRILLIDDVVTSSATLGAAATALLRHGAGCVTGAVVAKTPKPDRRAAYPRSAQREEGGRRPL